jgi:hypothetical protein
MYVHLHLAGPGPGLGAGWENDDVMLGKGGVRGGLEMGHLQVLACPAARFGWRHLHSASSQHHVIPPAVNAGVQGVWGGMGEVVGVPTVEHAMDTGLCEWVVGWERNALFFSRSVLSRWLSACASPTLKGILPLRICASAVRLSRGRSVVLIPVPASPPTPFDNTYQPCQPNPVPWSGRLPCMRGPY